MAIPNKGIRDTSPFKVADYPIEFPRVDTDVTRTQDRLNRWYYDLRTVLLRERDYLFKRIGEADATDDLSELEASVTARLDALEAAVTALQTQVTNITTNLNTVVDGLAAHVAALQAHGSNGNVAGLNDLGSAASAQSFQAFAVNSSGVTNFTFPAAARVCVAAITVQAGDASYQHNFILSSANRVAGDRIYFKLQLPDSTNPGLVFTDSNSAGDVVQVWEHDGTAGFLNMMLVFNSNLNWYVHSLGNLEAL